MKSLNIYCCLIVEEESNLWHRQFTDTLIESGHQVFRPPQIGLRESWFLMGQGVWNKQYQFALTEKILSDVKQRHQEQGVDLFFCYLYPFQFTPELFRSLAELSIPTVYFFCDNFAYPNVAAEYAPFATLNWVPELEAVEQFRQSGSNFLHLPMAANPKYNHPTLVNEDIDVSFLGSKNPYRRKILGEVLQSGLKLQVYGDGWHPECQSYHQLELEQPSNFLIPEPNFSTKMFRYLRWKMTALKQFSTYGLMPKVNSQKYSALGAEYDLLFAEVANQQPLTSSAANNIFSQSKVTIGINDQFNPLKKDPIVIYSKLREFEATMAGACYLTQATPDQAQLFEVDREIMTYTSVPELIDKANFLLNNDQFRQQMRTSARARSLRDHTWQNRVDRIFQELGIG